MAKEQIHLVWVTWARGIDLPPISPAAALKKYPEAFIRLFLEMAKVLNAQVEFVSPVLPSPVSSPPSRSSNPTPFKPLRLFEVEDTGKLTEWELNQ